MRAAASRRAGCARAAAVSEGEGGQKASCAAGQLTLPCPPPPCAVFAAMQVLPLTSRLHIDLTPFAADEPRPTFLFLAANCLKEIPERTSAYVLRQAMVDALGDIAPDVKVGGLRGARQGGAARKCALVCR